MAASPISVWADVGGTFTDCIVRVAGQTRETKVLSNGLIRAAVESVIDEESLRLQALPVANVRRFWCGAKASIIQADGSTTPLGTIVDHRDHVVAFDQAIPPNLVVRQATVEINTGLEAPVLATRCLLELPINQKLPPLQVRLGTTRGTNALLIRRGAETALLVTKGFRDVLRIGDQDRPDLFALSILKPPPLTDRVVEVSERLDADGNVLAPVDIGQLERELETLQAGGTESIAICLMHSHVNDAHEQLVADIAKRMGFQNVSRSSALVRQIKLVARAETTTLDAYLNPVLASYVAKVWDEFGGPDGCRFRLMTSSGNLVAPGAFRGRDSILSGPAGGVVALGHVARIAGTESAIGLDMGGTSTDVSRFVGSVGRRYESRVAGVRVMTPMMDIETIAAGGGSICAFNDDGRLTVGPASAGADPGPACYGRGGPLTITDVNLLLGRIPKHRFPFPLNLDAARRRLQEIRRRIDNSGKFDSDEQLADGFLQIAVTHMAEAVRNVSTAQGTDVRDMALVGFGGAAGQHVCKVASALGMQRIVDHPQAGLMSALGMGMANIGRVVSRGVYQTLTPETFATIDSIKQSLQSTALDRLRAETDGELSCRFDDQCDLRYIGTESTLPLTIEPKQTLVGRFHELHQQTFGYCQPDRSIELATIRCEATLPNDESPTLVDTASSWSQETMRIWHDGDWIDVASIDRASLRANDEVPSPAMIVGRHSTLLVEPGWRGKVIDQGIIELTTTQPPSSRSTVNAGAPVEKNDLVLLEVVARRLQGIADATGEVLRRTAISVNVKERRDYSCAVFRRDGSLIANAPHVPVHLGAMGHTVRHLINRFPEMSPGDCFLSNDPFAGGSHLPDLTVVTPVHCENDRSPSFFIASRAHHAEIGGRTPGSMPPDATSLAEEGVLIRDFALVRSGQSYREELRTLLSGGPYPSRCVDENLADIAAQQAAGEHGAAALRELAADYSPEIVEAYMSQLLDVAADSMQRWISSWNDQPKHFQDVLDDGSQIAVAMQRRSGKLEIKFTTSGVHKFGFNATPAIVTAAVLYVLRMVSGSDLPLCDGVMRDVDVQIPTGLLNPPAFADPAKCAAVVAGNVETSQRVVDVLLGALGVAAASQGTMNNVLIGDDSFGYYETIGGGSGATADSAGADAVHTHMTNTRITDPEILESRLPVRLHRFEIRRGSGGAGTHRGGDGIIRHFEFLKPLVVSLLTSRRATEPYGIDGGDHGKSGQNILLCNGTPSKLPPTISLEVQQSDQLIIKTPGGGGWGSHTG